MPMAFVVKLLIFCHQIHHHCRSALNLAFASLGTSFQKLSGGRITQMTKSVPFHAFLDAMCTL